MTKKTLAVAAVSAALTAAAFLLNPSPEQHRAKIREAVAQRSLLAGWLGMGALQAFVSSYHSLGVASYTTVKDKVVSVGAFGVVVAVEPKPEK